MKLNLLVSVGKAAGKMIPITIPQFIVGRDPQCHLRPASAVISKRHCALTIRDGRAYIKDFDSTNGTLVNDQRIEGEVELHDDDSLKIGPLSFIVKIETSVPVDKPTPPPKTKGGEEDDVAAMLLAMQDGSDGAKAAGLQEVPEGSTVLDIPAMSLNDTQQSQPGQAGKKPEKAAASGNTSTAAEAILAKYSRRRRGGG